MSSFAPNATIKAAQRAAMLARLREGPLSTLDARSQLGVLSPAARTLELRREGYRIKTERQTSIDTEGRPHRCGVYILLGASQ